MVQPAEDGLFRERNTCDAAVKHRRNFRLRLAVVPGPQ